MNSPQNGNEIRFDNSITIKQDERGEIRRHRTNILLALIGFYLSLTQVCPIFTDILQLISSDGITSNTTATIIRLSVDIFLLLAFFVLLIVIIVMTGTLWLGGRIYDYSSPFVTKVGGGGIRFIFVKMIALIVRIALWFGDKIPLKIIKRGRKKLWVEAYRYKLISPEIKAEDNITHHLSVMGYTKVLGKNLKNVDMCNADLSGANLIETDLVGAKLEAANLVGANLARANLAEANLCSANF